MFSKIKEPSKIQTEIQKALEFSIKINRWVFLEGTSVSWNYYLYDIISTLNDWNINLIKHHDLHLASLLFNLDMENSLSIEIVRELKGRWISIVDQYQKCIINPFDARECSVKTLALIIAERKIYSKYNEESQKNQIFQEILRDMRKLDFVSFFGEKAFEKALEK